MPVRAYKCETCDFELEQFEALKQAPLKKCPSCGKDDIEPQLFAPAGFVQREPKTVGQIADRKAKKVGKYESEFHREAAILSGQEAKDKARKAEVELNRKISKMSPNAKERFIMEGRV